MIGYAVDLEMDAALRNEYLAWLRGHVAEMLALPGFIDAEILERRDPQSPNGRWAVAAHYRLRDRAAWETYLSCHAPRMRAEGLARFGTRVQAVRRVLEAL